MTRILKEHNMMQLNDSYMEKNKNDNLSINDNECTKGLGFKEQVKKNNAHNVIYTRGNHYEKLKRL